MQISSSNIFNGKQGGGRGGVISPRHLPPSTASSCANLRTNPCFLPSYFSYMISAAWPWGINVFVLVVLQWKWTVNIYFIVHLTVLKWDHKKLFQEYTKVVILYECNPIAVWAAWNYNPIEVGVVRKYNLIAVGTQCNYIPVIIRTECKNNTAGSQCKYKSVGVERKYI